jgi:hypothetical protein
VEGFQGFQRTLFREDMVRGGDRESEMLYENFGGEDFFGGEDRVEGGREVDGGDADGEECGGGGEEWVDESQRQRDYMIETIDSDVLRFKTGQMFESGQETLREGLGNGDPNPFIGIDLNERQSNLSGLISDDRFFKKEAKFIKNNNKKSKGNPQDNNRPFQGQGSEPEPRISDAKENFDDFDPQRPFTVTGPTEFDAIAQDFDNSHRFTQKPSKENLIPHPSRGDKNGFRNTNIKEKIRTISQGPQRLYSYSVYDESYQIGRDALNKMDSLTDSIGVTPLSTWKLETNFDYSQIEAITDPINPQSPQNRSHCISDNLFPSTSKSQSLEKTGETFILFMFKYYRTETDDSLLSLPLLLSNLSLFFSISDPSLTTPILTHLTSLFNTSNHIKAHTFKLSVDSHSGLLPWFLTIAINAHKTSISAKFEAKTLLNERICLETERIVDEIRVKEANLCIKEKI